MNSMHDVRAVVAVNNAISTELARQDLMARNIPFRSVALIALRDINDPWFKECAVVLRYPGRPATGILGQWRFLGFYHSTARLLRKLQKHAELMDFYVVNNESLMTAHLFALAESNSSINVTVVAEGIMNFQDIGIENRAGWRWKVKPLVARVLGFRYREPKSHLSGAFEPSTKRVVSFAREGLKAPKEKLVLRQFDTAAPVRNCDSTVALIVLTGLNQWMPPEKFELFARSFVAWIEAAGYRKIQVKKHPRVSAGLIEDLLERYEVVGADQTTEAMAPELEAGTVIGACCTALVTLKLIRPDLECIDFGSDFYIEHAYHGDDSVKTLLSASGVTLVQIPAVPTNPPDRTESEL